MNTFWIIVSAYFLAMPLLLIANVAINSDEKEK